MLTKLSFEEALKALKLHPDCIDTEELVNVFLDEMTAGLDGKESSLLMIPSYMSAEGSITYDEPVAVLDAGGTNLRVASILFHEDGSPEILDLKRLKMPGTHGRITAKEMFAEFAEAVEPMISENGQIAFCFSYAVTALPGGEGQIIGSLSKEVEVEGTADLFIGKELIDALRERGYEGPLSVYVLNDTIAVLYSALTAGAEGAIGFILGTGTNTAYMEKAENIHNALPFDASQMCINLESGGFGYDPMGEIDIELNECSRNRDEHLHEKHVSGVYLGEIMARASKRLSAEGYFSKAFRDRVENIDKFDMRDVGEFLEDQSGALDDLCGTQEDKENLRSLILGVEERAGKLVAANLAAVLIKMRRSGTEGSIPVSENGTTFQKALPLRECCLSELEKFIEKTGPYHLVTRDDDTLIGSAASAFLH
ncbi:MAG: hypothetical protein Q4D71_01610 [Oscillospiraceae bacterium]|nr:hypothetical protein [Oscillospiraceae bacterium]